jgi:16S rRNA (uracil1498-N3)-methyltransferase
MVKRETFFVALEREERKPFLKTLLSAVNQKQESLSFLVGPEGGFSDQEISEIFKSGCQTVSLGQTILRAETAALMGLSLFHSLAGLKS